MHSLSLVLILFIQAFFTIGVNFYVLFFDAIFIYAGFSRYLRFAKSDYELSCIRLNESNI